MNKQNKNQRFIEDVAKHLGTATDRVDFIAKCLELDERIQNGEWD